MLQEDIRPYNKSSKKIEVISMFNKISEKYDFLNRFLSFGIDIYWRKKVYNIIKKNSPEIILDVATGTGDLAIKLSGISDVIGVDISEGMLQKAQQKIQKKKLEKNIKLQISDAECLPFEDNTFDVVTVAFGVRNFENLEKGLLEMKRVLKNNGEIVILEFSQPKNKLISYIYNFYSKYFMTFTGGIISKDKDAYKYLDISSRKFISGEKFLKLMSDIGFKNSKCKKLTFGIASIYLAER